jgi:hypothetical protein
LIYAVDYEGPIPSSSTPQMLQASLGGEHLPSLGNTDARGPLPRGPMRNGPLGPPQWVPSPIKPNGAAQGKIHMSPHTPPNGPPPPRLPPPRGPPPLRGPPMLPLGKPPPITPISMKTEATGKL